MKHNKRFARIWMIAFLWIMPISMVLAHGISEADKKAMLDGGNLQYIWLGATHMLTGYDHLLFIFGVIFFLTGFRDIVKFITAFTIGHSLTLLFATLLQITANYYLVDAVIALSVMYKGFENLDGFRKYLDMESPNLVWVIFGFGLIHGFGLSTRLQQLPLGDTGITMRILSFNVGVELGQIAALAVMLLIILAWRRTASFQRFSTASNFFLLLAGGFLFLMQMHGYAHTMYPDDFGFNRDAHYHDHINMKKKRSAPVSKRPSTQGTKGHGHAHDKGQGHAHDKGQDDSNGLMRPVPVRRKIVPQKRPKPRKRKKAKGQGHGHEHGHGHDHK